MARQTMRHRFMEDLAAKLAQRGIATLRYQFPYMEKRTKRPDSEGVLTDTVRAAVTAAKKQAGDLPLFAGGKSMGGRMPMKTEITPLLIVTKLSQYDYAGATALAVAILMMSFVLLFLINLLQWWSRARYA